MNNRWHGSVGLCVGMLVLLLAGCTTSSRQGPPPPLSANQRAAMQTKELQGDFNTAFTAAVSVLQDEGWQLDAVDKEGGIIQASSLKRQEFIGPEDDWRAGDRGYLKELQKSAQDAAKRGAAYPLWTRWDRLTLHVEPWQKKTVRMRLTIVKCGSLPSGTASGKKGQLVAVPGMEQSMVVDDGQVYKFLFQNIEKAIFVRQGLTNQ